jgi:hypothetical protein
MNKKSEEVEKIHQKPNKLRFDDKYDLQKLLPTIIHCLELRESC